VPPGARAPKWARQVSTPAIDAAVRRMFAQGLRVAEIGRQLDPPRSRGWVGLALRRLGLAGRRRPPVAPALRAEVLRLGRAGLPVARIRAATGCRYSSVESILQAAGIAPVKLAKDSAAKATPGPGATPGPDATPGPEALPRFANGNVNHRAVAHDARAAAEGPLRPCARCRAPLLRPAGWRPARGHSWDHCGPCEIALTRPGPRGTG